MDWIKKFFANRYLKSVLRYALVALAATMVDLPLLTELADFVKEHSDELAKILAAILMGYAGTWSTLKNRENAAVEKKKNVRVK